VKRTPCGVYVNGRALHLYSSPMVGLWSIFLTYPHATNVAEAPRGDLWLQEAIDVAKGAAAPLVHSHPDGAAPRPPFYGRSPAGPSLHLCEFGPRCIR
jgi:hypothetical protein